MLTVEKIDTRSGAQVNRFIRIPFRIYGKHPQWVPPILMDIKTQLNKNKHPFYEHSDADFFIAHRDGKDVGRIAALENRHFNEYHGTKQAQFYFFEAENDQEIANALFDTVAGWASQRGLDTIVGPKGFGALDGYGMLVDGFEHRQMMTMMNYNFPYYPKMVEALGFEKEVDFISRYMNAETFNLPEVVHRIAERVEKRGVLHVERFKSKKEMLKWAKRIGESYNKTFVNNWEYYPLTEKEIKFVIDSVLTIADPRLIKIISHDNEVVGFVFAFPDVSAAIQRSGGRLFPFGLIDMLLEMRRTKWVSLNGAGVLPEYQGRGGNALMYVEMERSVKDFHFVHADLTQVAETAINMTSDLVTLGGKDYKRHRVYHKKI